jgi:putative Ca2+/H+ antiporter (TMEM165/GDT1 family)
VTGGGNLLLGFAVVFLVVGGTELLDRTNFALIGLSSRQPPLPSWAGAASAFVLTSGLAVVLGAVLATALAPEIVFLRLGGGAFLIGYAAYLALVPEHERSLPTARGAFASAFLLIFLLELGDTTMILLILFATTVNPAVEFAAGASALAGVAAVACVIGSRLGARVEPRILERVVVVVLVGVGTATILYALFPGWFAGFT